MELRQLRAALVDAFGLVDMMPNSTLGYRTVGAVYLAAGEVGRAFEFFNQVSGTLLCFFFINLLLE